MNSAARLSALSLAAIVLLTPFLRAQAPPAPPAAAPATPPALYLGTAWYPEQWPESQWDADLSLMEAAHIRFVRVGEFAWSNLEPSEGHYDLDWLARSIRAAERHHIAVVIGTPSAAPPAWLTTKYPETLRIKEDGRRDEHGNRQQFNWANPKYRELARAMAEQLAKRFGHDPNVIGWQIDNEYASESFGPAEQAQFQQWLKARYGTLDNLNNKWTTAYWSETYSDWSQIPIETTYGNPGLLLSWKRFVSDTWRSYQKNQLDVIRANSDHRQFITTNMMGFFDGYDHYTVSQDLDLASWDDYVGTGQLNPIYNGAAHDLTRGFLRKNFWVMETQPGFVNWSPDNNSLDKGAVRAMAWHDVGHGADAVSYWQWRSDLNGQEEYHGTLVGADGTPVPLYAEVAHLGADFAKAGPALAGTTVHSDVAILHSYDAFWAIDWQRHNHAFDPLAAMVAYYGAIRALTHSVDVVNPSVDLSQYKLVIAPALNLITDQQAKNLIDYVHSGGHLVLTQRSAMKTIDNALQPQRQPGPLVPLLGGRVDQFYALDTTIPISGAWGSGPTNTWAELLSTSNPETKVLMRYGKTPLGWLDDQPAAITRKIGNGSITYIGANLEGDTLANAAKWMVADANLHPEFGTLPPGVDLYIRSDAHHQVWILINFGDTPQTITLPSAFEDVLADASKATTHSVTLNRFDVVVLQRPIH
ncbi:beta-galactosidase [Granulicella sp. L46]|uniref:beta-galactosidase n=1 Tax=Granulicella sp. L46 TaxID=1641865 RepID=UPI00131E2488|nr:beta-galactosidase [Granulicella sp. L46]